MTRRSWTVLTLTSLAIAVAAFCWYWYDVPALPQVDLTTEAPAVVAAVEAAQDAVRRAPRSGQAWGELGLVYLGNELTAPAHVCFVQAERFDPANPAWPYLQARRLLVDDRDTAERALRRAVALTDPLGPDNVTPALVLAETLFDRDERAEAAALGRHVLEADPGNSRAAFNLGLIALADEQWAEAIAHLTRCGGDKYAGKRACAQLATAYQRQGQSAAAGLLGRRSREMPEDKPWPDPYVKQAQQFAAGPNRHFMHAHELSGTARTAEYLQAMHDFAAEAGDGVSQYRLGMALAMMEDYAGAEPVLRTALERSPDLVGAHYFLGIALLQQGDRLARQGKADTGARAKFQDAAAHLRRATELKPTHAQAHQTLGVCLTRLGASAQALAEYRSAVECRPEAVEAQLALGEALAAAGEREEAERHLEQAQRLAPGDPRPPAALARLRGAGTKRAVPSRP